MEMDPSPTTYGLCKAFVFPHMQTPLVTGLGQGTGQGGNDLPGSLPRGTGFLHWSSSPVSSPTLPGTHAASPVTHPAEYASNIFDVSTCPKSLAGKFPWSWSRCEVEAWLWWCVEEFALGGVEPQRFSMNGKALCLLTKSGFQHRAPYAGDVLYELLQKSLSKGLDFRQSALSMQMRTPEAASDTISLARHLCSTTTAINNISACRSTEGLGPGRNASPVHRLSKRYNDAEDALSPHREDEKDTPQLVLPLPLNLKKIAMEGTFESSSDSGCSSQDTMEDTKEPHPLLHRHQAAGSSPGHRRSPPGPLRSPPGHLRSPSGQQRSSLDHGSPSGHKGPPLDDSGPSPRGHLRSLLGRRGSPPAGSRSAPGDRSPPGHRRSPVGLGREGLLERLRRSPPEREEKGSRVSPPPAGHRRKPTSGTHHEWEDLGGTTAVLTDGLPLMTGKRRRPSLMMSSSSPPAGCRHLGSDAQSPTGEASPAECDRRQYQQGQGAGSSRPPPPDEPDECKPVISHEDSQNLAGQLIRSSSSSPGSRPAASSSSPRDGESGTGLASDGRSRRVWKEEEARWTEASRPNPDAEQDGSPPASEKEASGRPLLTEATRFVFFKSEKDPERVVDGDPERGPASWGIQGVPSGVIRNTADVGGSHPSHYPHCERDGVIISASRQLSEYAVARSPSKTAAIWRPGDLEGFPKVPSGFLTQTTRRQTGGETRSPVTFGLGESGCRTGKDGSCQAKAACRFLWDFLAQLLDDEAYAPYIRWKDKENRVFRFLKPDVVATLWGLQKNRSRMSYEKMSRSMRYYYKTDILCKVPGEKLTYRFLQDPKDIGNMQHFSNLRKKKTDPTSTAEGAVASQEGNLPEAGGGHHGSPAGSATSEPH